MYIMILMVKHVAFDVIGGIIGEEGEKGSDMATSQKTNEAISVGESESVEVSKGVKRSRIKVTLMSKKIPRGGYGPPRK